MSWLVWIVRCFLGWCFPSIGLPASTRREHPTPWPCFSRLRSVPVASLGKGIRTNTLQPRAIRRARWPTSCRHTPSIACPGSSTRLRTPPASSLLWEWASNRPARKCTSTASRTKAHTTRLSQICFSEISHRGGKLVTPTREWFWQLWKLTKESYHTRFHSSKVLWLISVFFPVSFCSHYHHFYHLSYNLGSTNLESCHLVFQSFSLIRFSSPFPSTLNSNIPWN